MLLSFPCLKTGSKLPGNFFFVLVNKLFIKKNPHLLSSYLPPKNGIFSKVLPAKGGCVSDTKYNPRTVNSIRSAAADPMNNAQGYIGSFVKRRDKRDKCITVLKAPYLVTLQKAMFWFTPILIFCFCYQSSDQGNPREFRMPSTSQPLRKDLL